MIADAPLGGAAVEVVLNPVAGEELDRSVVHVNREVHRQHPLNVAQDGANGRVDVQIFSGLVELELSRRKGIRPRLRAF